jgi:hypothetical protein
MDWCGNSFSNCDPHAEPDTWPATSLVLGDNNTAFATNQEELAAFDINTGAVLWTWTPPSGQLVGLVAAADGGGLFATKPNSTTGADDILQFDSSGSLVNTLNFGTGGTDMDPLGNFYGAQAGQLVAQNSSVAGSSKSPHSHRKGNPAHNGHAYSADAVPTNFRLVKAWDDFLTLSSVYKWDSSAGKNRLETLGKCVVSEYVTFPDKVGTRDNPIEYQPPSPPWPKGKGSTWKNPTFTWIPAAEGALQDNDVITNVAFVKPYSYNPFTGKQNYQYSCDGGKTYTDIPHGGPFDIVRSVMQDPSDGSWHYIVQKTGVKSNVDYPLP